MVVIDIEASSLIIPSTIDSLWIFLTTVLETDTGTIGYGASGRVSVGINPKGKLVALNRMAVGKDRTQVHEFRRTLETLTSLAESQDEHC